MSADTQTTFTFRLPKALHQDARIKSIQTKRPLNDVLIEKIQEWLDEDKSPDNKKRGSKTSAPSRLSN